MIDARNLDATEPRQAAWARGFATLLRKEASTWTGTTAAWLQPLLWLALLVGPLTLPLYLMRDVFEAETTGVLSVATEMFFTFVALAPAIGAVILMQGSVITERQLGTAAWILSKPVGRASFLLAKVAAHGVALLVAALALPGAAAYALLSLENGAPLASGPFVTGLGLAALHVTFYLVLTLALGAVTAIRGIVLAVPLALLLGSDVILGLVPDAGLVTPWLLPRFASAAAQGMTPPTTLPVVATLAWGVALVAVAIWRFGREDL